MTASRPQIVVTLTARTVPDVVRQIRLATEANADVAEVRVDRLPAAERSRLAELFPSRLPLIATYRSTAEGGEGEVDAAARAPVLLELAAQPFRWIDVELARDTGVISRLPPADRLGRIVSCHLGAGSRPLWTVRLRELEQAEGIGKLVVAASVGELIRDLLPEVRRGLDEVVVHTTGASGPLLRAWGRKLGLPLVYACLPAASEAEPVEPSQIPVDRLRSFFDADELAPLFAVCGRPVGHSLSPRLHSDWMARDGRPGLYLALEFEDDQEFLDALGPLADGGFRGLNVTHPFKAIAAESATELGPGAEACGAVNCLTLRDGGIQGENTDLLAILRRLEELRASGHWDGKQLAVLGAGGAARATLAAARDLGAKASVYARRSEPAGRVARDFGATLGDVSHPVASGLVVHATDVGRAPGPGLELPLAKLLRPRGFLLDWVYSPDDPTLRRAAAAASAAYEDGWRLLVYQAAASYEIWWGARPAGEAVARAVEEGPWPG